MASTKKISFDIEAKTDSAKKQIEELAKKFASMEQTAKGLVVDFNAKDAKDFCLLSSKKNTPNKSNSNLNQSNYKDSFFIDDLISQLSYNNNPGKGKNQGLNDTGNPNNNSQWKEESFKLSNEYKNELMFLQNQYSTKVKNLHNELFNQGEQQNENNKKIQGKNEDNYDGFTTFKKIGAKELETPKIQNSDFLNNMKISQEKNTNKNQIEIDPGKLRSANKEIDNLKIKNNINIELIKSKDDQLNYYEILLNLIESSGQFK